MDIYNYIFKSTHIYSEGKRDDLYLIMKNAILEDKGEKYVAKEMPNGYYSCFIDLKHNYCMNKNYSEKLEDIKFYINYCIDNAKSIDKKVTIITT